MTKERDVNSKRSKRRDAREFTASRPVRRAKRRLFSATGVYSPSDPSLRQPGSMKYW